jgi:hypothetical protein
MMAAISAMIQQGFGMTEISAAIGPYVSRGKGRGSPSRNFMRGAGRSKYEPHQGKQEIARRLARMQKGGCRRSTTKHLPEKTRSATATRRGS